MLLKISEQIGDCLAHATWARERAASTADLDIKAAYLDIEARWLKLAESYRFVEQANRFISDAYAHRQRE